MEYTTKGKTIRDYFEIEAASIYNRFKSIEAILPNSKGKGSIHTGEEGRFVESLIRNFLNKHLPKDLIAISGFIIKPATKTGKNNYSRVDNEFDKHSSQLDIIVYDQARFPVYERFDEFGIVPPEGVIAILSIKKNLRIRDIDPELKALKNSAKLCDEKDNRPPFTSLFSLTSEFNLTKKNLLTITEIYQKNYTQESYGQMLCELTVMDNFMIFKFDENQDKERIVFVNIDCKNKMHVSLQRMLQSILGVYYAKSLNNQIERPGYISLENGIHNNAPRFCYVKKASAD